MSLLNNYFLNLLSSFHLADHSSVSVIFHEEVTELDMMKAVLTAEIFFYSVDSFQLDQSIKAIDCMGHKIIKPVESLRINSTAHLLSLIHI